MLASPSLAGNESNMNRTTQAAAICLITFIGMRTAISSFLSDLSFDSTLFGVGSVTLSAKIDLAPITTLSFIVASLSLDSTTSASLEFSSTSS